MLAVAYLVAGLQYLVAKAVALGQQQHALVAQLFRANLLALFPLVALGCGHHEFFVVQRVGFGARFVERVSHDDGVHFAALEHFCQPCGVVFFQDQRHVRRQDAQCRNQARQQVGADGEDHPQLQRPCQLVLVFAGQAFHQLGLLQHAL